ncbi:MAG: Gfo/Idh/MocA family oxidoreductase [Balneolales bacterium]
MKKVKEDKITWGIIGAGDVCEIKSAPAMNKVPDSSIRAIMRRNAVKAEDYAKRHKIPIWHTDADRIINDPEINAVYIATPPASHAELAIKAAGAGKPVYVEKPMARTHNECLDMIKAFEKANVPLYVAYYRRALPNFLKVRDLINSEAIGDVRMVNIELYQPLEQDPVMGQENPWRVDPEVAGGGHFYDLASHQLDILDFILGPIKQAGGFSANQAKMYKAEDIVTSSFIFDNGVLGCGSWCFTTGRSVEKEITTIIGSRGKISFGTFNTTVTIDTDYSGSETFEFQMPDHIQQPLIERVVNDLLGKGSSPSTGTSGARTNLIMEKMCNPG